MPGFYVRSLLRARTLPAPHLAPLTLALIYCPSPELSKLPYGRTGAVDQQPGAPRVASVELMCLSPRVAPPAGWRIPRPLAGGGRGPSLVCPCPPPTDGTVTGPVQAIPGRVTASLSSCHCHCSCLTDHTLRPRGQRCKGVKAQPQVALVTVWEITLPHHLPAEQGCSSPRSLRASTVPSVNCHVTPLTSHILSWTHTLTVHYCVPSPRA